MSFLTFSLQPAYKIYIFVGNSPFKVQGQYFSYAL